MEQLLAHLDRLPPYDQHLVQIMSVMGLRSVDALHLAEDCLEYDAAGDPRVRWYNVKMKREVRLLPVSREVEAAILAQRELVAAAAATRNTCHVRCRLSGSPGLQNLPVRPASGRPGRRNSAFARSAVLPSEGYSRNTRCRKERSCEGCPDRAPAGMGTDAGT